MSQALNRLRAIVSLPKYSPPMPRPRRATAVGWRDRLESDPRRRRQRDAGARLEGEGGRHVGDAHRPWRGLAGRRPARPRAAGRRGVGPVEDARRGAQGDRCLAGGDYMSQALNRQRAMGSLPEYSPPMLRPATGGPRIDGVICWNRICAVAEDRSRRNHHPGNQRPLPARVAAPVFPPFPPQEDAVVLTIPRVRSRN
jgi:hypothetical protein